MWAGGGGGRCCHVRGLVMGFPSVDAGGGTCRGVCRRGLGVVGVGGGLRVVCEWSGPRGGGGGGDGVGVALLVAGGGRGWVLC